MTIRLSYPFLSFGIDLKSTAKSFHPRSGTGSGFSDSPNVQRLPFGLYLKVVSSSRKESLVNEHGSLQLVRKHTELPVPTPFDLVEDMDNIYLLTTRIKGYKLGWCLDTMTDEDTAALANDLGKHWKALRNIPRPSSHKNAISNVVDGPVFDYRINAALDQDEEEGLGDTVGPFATEADFNNTLKCGAILDVMHDNGHDIVLTHGDINMRNILVDESGKLTGVVDWENAGWLPDYWDYTKAYFVTKRNKRWLAVVDEVFRRFGDFKGELQVERELWEYCF
ncbi:kinase-like domain-containing protein [Triangularia setosa]|uniref:Kinase-like domain-containing protein n=1 Tax=Triangularia setosa TaxID=2587417 RepID=A0AAN7A1L2_9PEZI|nr:kinase-like domain-containing protein [Podospora setosa]